MDGKLAVVEGGMGGMRCLREGWVTRGAWGGGGEGMVSQGVGVSWHDLRVLALWHVFAE